MNLYRISYAWRAGGKIFRASTAFKSPVTNCRAAVAVFCQLHPHVISASAMPEKPGVVTLAANQNASCGT